MAQRRLGLFLGRSSAEACFLERGRRRGPKILARTIAEASAPLWEEGHAGLRPLFRKLAKSLPSDARRADVDQRISLPDPLVTEDRFGFRDLPGNPEEARELILWRVARELRRPPESFGCAWQVEKVQGEETEVLVRIVDRTILDAVLDAAASAGIFPSRLEGWSGYVLGRDDVTKAAAGARLWANDDWWTLVCWARPDGGAAPGKETLVHAEWRDGRMPVRTIAEKVARLAKSFAMSSGSPRLALDLDMPAALGAELRAALGPHAGLQSHAEAGPAEIRGADCVALDMS